MLFKGLEVKDIENNKYFVVECNDIHNIQLKSDEWNSLWCADSNCSDYDGELYPVNLKKIRKQKLEQIFKL